MARNSDIEWCNSSWTPWWGCTEVSDGCRNCWARRMTRGGAWGKNPRERTKRKYWRDPLIWNADAPRFQREHGHKQRVFMAQIADFFDNQAPPQWRADAWKLVDATPDLTWQFLTKRPSNIAGMLPPNWGEGYPHVWLGISVENEAYYRQRWPILARIPAAIRFISYEPALGSLGPLDIGIGVLPDWVIVGGEDAAQRPMDLAWARDVRDQCARHDIAFFFKQTAGKGPIPADLMIREYPDDPGRSGATP